MQFNNQSGIYTGRNTRRVYNNYLSNQSNGLGLMQIMIGILCILFNSIALAFADSAAVVGHGLWNGLLFIITGSFGVYAGQNKTRCPIVAFMVLCIISSVTTLSLLSVAIIGAILSDRNGNTCSGKQARYYNYPCNNVVVAMESLLAVLAFIEAIVAIWGSAICCRSICCCAPSQHERTYLPQYIYPDQQQMMMFNQMQIPGGQVCYTPQMQQCVGAPAYQPSIQMVVPPPYQQQQQQSGDWSAINHGYNGPPVPIWNQPPPQPSAPTTHPPQIVSIINQTDGSPPIYDNSMTSPAITNQDNMATEEHKVSGNDQNNKY